MVIVHGLITIITKDNCYKNGWNHFDLESFTQLKKVLYVQRSVYDLVTYYCFMDTLTII